ncbi:MAG: hypothetical protein EZS28_044037 [Streblomastix strix]|uniref:Uncharacterized protein n=1 Tax=Streblomastix strix TaxID=222440 RepID=A0A5J4TPQ0_9EUKA|nr:MAG: hypothetical protein EZS28_044037 [Streblomastix strix]
MRIALVLMLVTVVANLIVYFFAIIVIIGFLLGLVCYQFKLGLKGGEIMDTNYDTIMNKGGNPVPRSKGDGIGEKLDLAPNAHNWSLQPNSKVTTKAKSCSSLSQLEQVAANQCYNYAQVSSCYFSSEMTASTKTKFDFIEMLEFFVMLEKLKEIWIEPVDAELIRYDYGYNYCEL